MKFSAVTNAIRRVAYIVGYRTYVPTDYIVLEQRKIIYVPIPKAACTTVKSMLARHLPIEEQVISNRKLLHRVIEKHSRHTPPKDSNDYYVFSVVRDPLARLISCYKNKFVQSGGSSSNYLFDSFYNRVVIKKLVGQPLCAGMSFGEFVHAVCRIPDAFADAHFKSQSSILKQHPIHYDALLKLEDSQALENGLKEIFGVDEVPLRNRSGNTAGTLPPLSETMIQEIYHRYKNDYQLLGYDVPSPTA